MSEPPIESAAASPATSALRERYDAYRLRQGRDLLNLVPRDGLRSLVRGCRERVAAPAGTDVSLDNLAAHCADLMPLPPLKVWMADLQSNRVAHLAEGTSPGAGPRSPDGSPVVMAVRHFRHGGKEWVGQLHVWPRDDRWEGAIQFHSGDTESNGRTAPIFREPSAEGVRDRFGSFDDSTLSAFLRSSLP